MNPINDKSHCPSCGCNGCPLYENCPVQQFTCEECTPSNPAWQGCFYKQKEKIKEDRDGQHTI